MRGDMCSAGTMLSHPPEMNPAGEAPVRRLLPGLALVLAVVSFPSFAAAQYPYPPPPPSPYPAYAAESELADCRQAERSGGLRRRLLRRQSRRLRRNVPAPSRRARATRNRHSPRRLPQPAPAALSEPEHDAENRGHARETRPGRAAGAGPGSCAADGDPRRRPADMPPPRSTGPRRGPSRRPRPRSHSPASPPSPRSPDGSRPAPATTSGSSVDSGSARQRHRPHRRRTLVGTVIVDEQLIVQVPEGRHHVEVGRDGFETFSRKSTSGPARPRRSTSA